MLEKLENVASTPTIEQTKPASTPNIVTSQPVNSQATTQINKLVIWLPPQFDPQSGTEAGNLLQTQINQLSNNNNGIEIEVRLKAVSGVGGMLNSLSTTSLAAPANLPNVLVLSRADFESAAADGLLYPLTGLSLYTDNPDLFAFVKPLSEVDGVQYGVPFANDPLVTAYHSTLGAFPPDTWQEVSQQSAEFTFPAADPRGLIPLLMYLSAGGTYLDDQGKFTLQSEVLKNVNFAFYNGLSTGAFPYWLAQYDSFAKSWEVFSQGNSKMTAIWASAVLGSQDTGTYIYPLPSYTSEQITFVDSWILCIPAYNASTADLGMKVIDSFSDVEFQQSWSEAAGYLPSNSTALAAWQNHDLQVMMMNIATSAIPVPSNDTLTKVGIIFMESTTDFLTQRVNVEQAAEQALQKISTLN